MSTVRDPIKKPAPAAKPPPPKKPRRKPIEYTYHCATGTYSMGIDTLLQFIATHAKKPDEEP